jgi:RNA polymerase sigma-70 factor (ECF subfamily)
VSGIVTPSPRPAEPDDFALMAALREGDPRAFPALSERWRGRLVNFFRGLGADPHGAEDCAQEALLRVFRYRDDYRPDHPFPAFLFTLARRAFLDWRRKARRHDARSAPLPDDPAPPGAPSDPVAEAAERVDLAEAVAQLPRRLRDVVELGAIRGLPYHQVAVLLGVPVGTVKSRMHHAVRRLRALLGEAD